VGWIKRDQVNGATVDHRRHDALRRYTRQPGNCGESHRHAGVQCLVCRLHCQQARGDIYQRGARYDDEVGTHPRETRRDAGAQRPTGDEAGKADADLKHYRNAEKDRTKPTPADVLCRHA
jgi:hypothetical protein